MIRRWICAFMVMVLAAGLWYVAATTYDPLYGAVVADEVIVEEPDIDSDMNIVTLWYNDEALTEYLQSVSLSFQHSQGVKVNLVLKDGVEFLEAINSISIDENPQEAMPDLYITSHNNLLRAYLAGLAEVVKDPQNIMTKASFPNTALRAVSCYGEYVAYPFYYETNYFLYNKTYMADLAKNKIDSETDLVDGQEAQKAIDENGGEVKSEETDATDDKKADESDDNKEEESVESLDEEDKNEPNETIEGDGEESKSLDGEEYEDPMGEEDSIVDEEVLERLSTMIPATLEDVTTFANNYDAPNEVESVFKWDVTDIFYNYFFVGNYVDVGGENGDNAAVFNIYNSQAVECLKKFQGMNQFFTIDAKVDNYDSILQDFIDGKMVFTVATTDAIAKINKAKQEGRFNYDYGVTTLPDIDELLKTKGLSVTDAVAINGYSKKKDIANLLASYVALGKADELYDLSGKVSCGLHINQEDEEISNIMQEYENSEPLPKMVEAANYWVQLEIAFRKVWDGADPDETLRELSDTIGAQIEEIKINLPLQESFTAGATKLLW